MGIGYLQIVFAGFWGVMIFGEHPDLFGVGGAALIIVGALWLQRIPVASPGGRGP